MSDRPVFVHVFDEAGTVYVTLRVENPYGRAEKEFRVDVGELAPPVIALDIPAEGVAVAAGREYRFEPEVRSEDAPTYAWYLDGGDEPVSTEKDYTFSHTAVGPHTLLFTAANADGESKRGNNRACHRRRKGRNNFHPVMLPPRPDQAHRVARPNAVPPPFGGERRRSRIFVVCGRRVAAGA